MSGSTGLNAKWTGQHCSIVEAQTQAKKEPASELDDRSEGHVQQPKTPITTVPQFPHLHMSMINSRTCQIS
jgi:hypothetical protein